MFVPLLLSLRGVDSIGSIGGAGAASALIFIDARMLSEANNDLQMIKRQYLKKNRSCRIVLRARLDLPNTILRTTAMKISIRLHHES